MYLLLFTPTKSARTLILFSSQKNDGRCKVQIRFGLLEFKDKLKYLTSWPFLCFNEKRKKIKQPRRHRNIYFLFEKMYNREKIQTWTQLGICFSTQVCGGPSALVPNGPSALVTSPQQTVQEYSESQKWRNYCKERIFLSRYYSVWDFTTCFSFCDLYFTTILIWLVTSVFTIRVQMTVHDFNPILSVSGRTPKSWTIFIFYKYWSGCPSSCQLVILFWSCAETSSRNRTNTSIGIWILGWNCLYNWVLGFILYQSRTCSGQGSHIFS